MCTKTIHFIAGFCIGFTTGIKIVLNYINNKMYNKSNEPSQVCPALVQESSSDM